MTQTQPQLQGDYNNASERHWLYGFNAFALVIVGLAVLALILYMCNTDGARKFTRWDWTSNGANSLSGSTLKMLKEVDSKGENYTLISLFTPPTDQDKEDKTSAQTSQERQQVLDLLRQYSKNSSHIKVEDLGEASHEDIEKRVREKYKGDIDQYTQVITDFSGLSKDLSDFFKKQAEAIAASGQKPGTPADEMQVAAELQANFASVPSALNQLDRAIRRESDSTMPEYTAMTGLINDALDQLHLQQLFELLGDPAKLKSLGAPKTLQDYFTSQQDEYKKMAARVKTFTDAMAKLTGLKVQDVINGLDKDTVVILGDNAAKVIPAGKIYSPGPTSASGKTSETFNGEQPISSALFAMANPNKIKVVFVTATAQHLLTDSYSDMQQTLTDNNFDVSEWSPPAAPTPDNPTPQAANPPAEGKGVVWVVFTPDAPEGQMAMFSPPPDARPVLEAVRKHMNEGGQVLFLADPSTSGFAYDELVKSFGINVQPKYTVYQNQQARDQTTGETVSRPLPYAIVSRFEKHEITAPLQALDLATVFGPAQAASGGAAGYATVVGLVKPLPTGIDATVLVNTPTSTEYWGESDPPGMGTAKYDAGTDLAPPLSLAAVAIKNKGQKDKDGNSSEQRIAVIGAKMLGANYFLELSVNELIGNTIVPIPRFPGNEELFKNTILWLSGYENMIAVSAKADPAARIGDVTPGLLGFIRVGIVALLPLGVLFIGGVIYFARRR